MKEKSLQKILSRIVERHFGTWCLASCKSTACALPHYRTKRQSEPSTGRSAGWCRYPCGRKPWRDTSAPVSRYFTPLSSCWRVHLLRLLRENVGISRATSLKMYSDCAVCVSCVTWYFFTKSDRPFSWNYGFVVPTQWRDNRAYRASFVSKVCAVNRSS